MAESQPAAKIADEAFVITRMVAKFHVEPRNVNDSFSTDVYSQLLLKTDEEKLFFTKDPGYLPVSVEIAKPVGLPQFAYYKPRNRYKADSLLKFLAAIRGSSNFIAGITMSDISTRKGNINDYGVMGLGLQPGNECVVSLSRLRGDNPSQSLLMQAKGQFVS
ncbi:MAG TPA: hypothetical protein VG738_16695 [Chitinophagaceae bacterium]|nr:hypothetical protein [Chitinophagaceae bacterium]